MKGRHSGKGSRPGAAHGGPRTSKPSRLSPSDRRPERQPQRRVQRNSENAAEPRSGGRDRWVIGIHSCEETLKIRPHAVRELWLREDFETAPALRSIAELAEACGITVRSRTQGQLDALGSGHQGVALAVTESPQLVWDALKEAGHKLVLVLDGIEDPHNLGSMLRTAWLTGVSAVLIPEDRAVGVTPSVCKVASGGAEHVPVETCSNLASALKELKDAGFWVYGLSEKGARRPWDYKLPEKVAWVIGSEGSGLRVTTERACDELVRIPQVSSGSSFNAAIAAGMALMETCRQFGKPE